MPNQTLYHTTTTFLELAKQVKPEIKIESDYNWHEYTNSGGSDYRIEHISVQEDYNDYGSNKIICPAITTDCLLSLIPQLFEGVENPEYTEIKSRPKYNSDEVSYDYGQETKTPQDLSTALIRRYFEYTDGQNWWQRSQEGVILDLIKEIKKHLLK